MDLTVLGHTSNKILSNRTDNSQTIRNCTSLFANIVILSNFDDCTHVAYILPRINEVKQTIYSYTTLYYATKVNDMQC